jgi:hypothetical protein
MYRSLAEHPRRRIRGVPLSVVALDAEANGSGRTVESIREALGARWR